MRTLRSRPLALLAAVALVGLSSCGQAADPAPHPAAATPARHQLTDPEIARTAHLRLADLPARWVATGIRTRLHCAGVHRFLVTASAHATGPTFHAPERVHIEQTVSVYATVRAAVRVEADLSSAATEACIGREIARIVRSRDDVIRTTAARLVLTDTHPFGEAGFAARFLIHVIATGGPVNTYVDVVVSRVERGVSLIVATSAFEPTAEELLKTSHDATVGRLRTALERSPTRS